MSDPRSQTSVTVNLTTAPAPAHARPDSDTPFRIALLGDFTGRAYRSTPPGATLAGRRPVQVDRDNFDEVLTRMGVELALPLLDKDSPPLTVQFTELDDFHPDHLFQRL